VVKSGLPLQIFLLLHNIKYHSIWLCTDHISLFGADLIRKVCISFITRVYLESINPLCFNNPFQQDAFTSRCETGRQMPREYCPPSPLNMAGKPRYKITNLPEVLSFETTQRQPVVDCSFRLMLATIVNLYYSFQFAGSANLRLLGQS
jgi:hypothetical protein